VADVDRNQLIVVQSRSRIVDLANSIGYDRAIDGGFMSTAFEFILDNLRVLPIAGLFSWLGAVWASRIARDEAHGLSKEIEKLRSDLSVQSALVAQAQHSSFLDRAEITRRQLDALTNMWSKWLEFRNETGNFTTPHQILTPTELKSPVHFKKIFPFDAGKVGEKMDRAMKIMSEIEKTKPFIPTPIYQHLKAVSILYARLGIHWMQAVESGQYKIQPWYQDSGGKTDFAVKGLLQYSASTSLKLPNPESEADVRATFSVWKEELENFFAQLIQKFVEGSLDRQMEIHKSIKEMMAKGQSSSPT
jgi:hypothetical protein